MQEIFTAQVMQLAISLAAMILTGIVGLGLKTLNAYVASKIGAAKWASLKERAYMIVSYLAQCPVSEGWDGSEKKQYALVDLLQYAEAQGIKIVEDYAEAAMEKSGMAIPRADLDKMIEEAVAAFKSGIKPQPVIMPELAK